MTSSATTVAQLLLAINNQRVTRHRHAFDLAELANILQSNPGLTREADDGTTLLHAAATLGDAALCRLLIAHGADVDAKNKYEDRPLHLAAAANKMEACCALVDSGADVHAAGVGGETPLHIAAKISLPMTKLMVQAGGDPGFTPAQLVADYLTPFQAAIRFGTVSEVQGVVQFMVTECGQSLNQTTRDGKSMGELAEQFPTLQAFLHALNTELAVRAALLPEEAPATAAPSRKTNTMAL